MGTRENNFKTQRNCANTGKILSVFISPVLSSVSKELQNLFSTINLVPRAFIPLYKRSENETLRTRFISNGKFQISLYTTFWHSLSTRRAPFFTVLHNTESIWIEHKLKINYLRKLSLRRLGTSTWACMANDSFSIFS